VAAGTKPRRRPLAGSGAAEAGSSGEGKIGFAEFEEDLVVGEHGGEGMSRIGKFLLID